MSKVCCCCGKAFDSIPDDAREHRQGELIDGFYWECECGSTLYIPLIEQEDVCDI